jgi:hypothetical protein
MRYFIIAYLAVYALIIVGMIVGSLLPPDAGEEKESAWDHAMDAVTAAALMAGMVFILIEVNPPLLKHIWKVLVPVVVGCQVWLSWRARGEAIARGEGKKNPRRVALQDFGTLILIAPAFVLNMHFAFR